MAQVQVTVTITVSAPLSVGANTGSAAFVEGVPSTAIITPVTAGAPPYEAALDANSPNPMPPGLAPGIDANNNLIISGTATATGGPAPVLIDVLDSTGASVLKASAKI